MRIMEWKPVYPYRLIYTYNVDNRTYLFIRDTFTGCIVVYYMEVRM